MSSVLREFVIGSSAIVVLPFFYIVSKFTPDKFNFDYKSYTFLAPIVLGLMNVISFLLLGHSPYRYLLTSLVAPTIVLFTVVYFKIYNYTPREWRQHILKLYLMYFFIFNVVVYNLDKYV